MKSLRFSGFGHGNTGNHKIIGIRNRVIWCKSMVEELEEDAFGSNEEGGL
jgi:hypothetical protein